MFKSKSRIGCIVQARTSSARLPKKVLRDIGNGKSFIEYQLSRLKRKLEVDNLILATTTNKCDEPLVAIATKLGIDYFCGDEFDVLLRYYECAKQYSLDRIVRITGDCPLIDLTLVNEGIKKFESGEFRYLTNAWPPTYPDGLDYEIFDSEILEKAHKTSVTKYEREHVTPWIRNYAEQTNSKYEVRNNIDYSLLRWTLDEVEDEILIKKIIKSFGFNEDIDWLSILNIVQENPELSKINESYTRNQGSKISHGEKLWKRARSVIPDGNMLLSKRSEMFLAEGWPSYFEKTKGCKVWTMDKDVLIDAAYMGVGTNVLGYSNENIDKKVIENVQKGNLCTLNCPEEVQLCEKLVELNPWAHKVKLARTGGEANAIAVRIARAATGKDKVAICGYHGWHDWYISANIGGDNNGLATHLIPGIPSNGVPKNLANTTLPFKYNDIEEVYNLIKYHDLAAIKMEVCRNIPPKKGYLEAIREACTQNGIALIFDECTSGFRETPCGLYQRFNVEPDIVIYGKTLGNGYAITAVVGKESIMDYASKTFISSTFWTERIGPTAALASIDEMNRVKSWEMLPKIGRNVKDGWEKISKESEVPIKISGLDSLATYNFVNDSNNIKKTFFTKRMLEKGYLATTAFYACIAHTDIILDGYLNCAKEVFDEISRIGDEDLMLKIVGGTTCQTPFGRLN